MIVSEDLIWITVKTIANYYEVKLADVAHNLSVDEYKMIRADIQKLRESAERGKFYWNYDFYLDFCWMNTGLAQLAPKNWQVVSAFFSVAHEYIDRKNNKQNMMQVEQELAARVKQVNLKLGFALFKPLRNMFLYPSHFLSR